MSQNIGNDTKFMILPIIGPKKPHFLSQESWFDIDHSTADSAKMTYITQRNDRHPRTAMTTIGRHCLPVKDN